MHEIFDDWPERYDLWFQTPIGKLIREVEKRLLLDMAQHYNQGPIQLGDIAKRQEISLKYLEQIIIPLKKAHFIETVRGIGYRLRDPDQ